MNDFYKNQIDLVDSNERLRSHYDRVDRLINSTNNQNTDSLKDLILNRAKSELNIKDLKILANYIEQKANWLSEDKASVLYWLAADLYITSPQQQDQQQQNNNNYPSQFPIPYQHKPEIVRNEIILPEWYSLYWNIDKPSINISWPNEEWIFDIEITISKPRWKILKEIKSYEILFKNNSWIVYFYDKFTRRQISYSIIDNHWNTTLNYNWIAMKINVAKPRIYDRRENRRH